MYHNQKEGVYHQMPQSAPVLHGHQTQPFVDRQQTHLPPYSYVPQALPSFGASALGGLPQPTTFAAQTGCESFGFNQNEFVQQVVQMSAIKEMEEPLSATSEEVDHQDQRVEKEETAVALNESMISAGSGAGARSELAAVRVAAGWESKVDLAPVVASAVEAKADSENVTNEHSPAESPKHKEEHVFVSGYIASQKMTQAITPIIPERAVIALVVAKEVNKLVALLRNTARFASVGDGATDADYLEKLSRSKYEATGALNALMVALRISIDPGISAPITAAALEAASELFGTTLTAKEQSDCVSQVVHLACKTQFPEIDRERDELVYLALLNLLRIAGVKADVAHCDEALVVVSRLAFTTNAHSAVLCKLAKRTFVELSLHRFDLPGGVAWLTVDVRRWLETAVAQLNGSPAVEDRIDALVELLFAIRRERAAAANGTKSQEVDLLIEYAVNTLLYHLLPGGQAAELAGAQQGAVLKNPSLYGVLGKVLALAVDLLSCKSDLNTTERVLMALLRPVSITSPESPDNTNAVDKVGGRRRWFNSPRIIALCLDAITEACKLNPRLMGFCFARLDLDWRRVPVAAGVMDSVCSVILGSLAVDFSNENITARAKIQALLASLPDALAMDPPGQRLGSAEHAGLRLLSEVLMDPGSYSSLFDCSDAAASSPGRLAEVRAAVAATFEQVKEKPKRTREFIETLQQKYPVLRIKSTNPGTAECSDPVISFVRFARGVPLEAIGEWLGQPGNEAEIEKYVATFDLRNMDIEETMRTVLATFRLPGEAQQISRVVEGIAKTHYEANAAGGNANGNAVFKSVDAAYTFLFSVIMLNTDQHNPNVTKRMELRDFLRNNRGINDGEDIDEEYQRTVFNSIRSQQILTPKSDSLWAAPVWVRLVDKQFRSGHDNTHQSTAESTLLEARGYDLLAALSYASNMDPEDGEGYLACGVVDSLGRLAEHCFRSSGGVLRDLADDTVAVLRRNAINLFSGAMTKCRRNLRCLQVLLALVERHYSSPLMQAVSEAVILYSVYAVVLIEGASRPRATSAPSSPVSSVLPLRFELQRIIGVKESSGSSSSGGISGFLMKALFVEEPLTPEGSPAQEDWVMPEEVYWRWMIPEGLEEGPLVVELLEVLRSEKKLFTKIPSKVLVSCFELLTRPNCPDYLLQSGPWMIVLALRLAEQENADIDVPVLVACLKLVARGLLEQTGRNARAVKINLAATLLLMARLSKLDPAHCDSAWLGDFMKDAVKSPEVAARISHALALSVKLLVTEGEKGWIKKFSTEVWRGIVTALETCATKNPQPEILREALELVLLHDNFAERGHALYDEALNVYEGFVSGKRVENAKTLVDLALKASSSHGPLNCWMSVYSRICTRAVSASKSKKSELLIEELGSFRTLLAAGTSLSISLTSVQAAAILEKAVSVLSAVVALPAVSSNLVQGLISVFNRFFLSALDLLVAHPQFDQLWLMALRAVLLAVKRGSDAEVDDGLYDVVTENLKNTLQLLVTAGVVDVPEASEGTTPVWWKVTWDSVGSFCPGVVEEIMEALRPGLSANQVAVEEVSMSETPAGSEEIAPESGDAPAELLVDNPESPPEQSELSDTGTVGH